MLVATIHLTMSLIQYPPNNRQMQNKTKFQVNVW